LVGEEAISLKQLTITGIDTELGRRIRIEAAQTGVSLNEAGLRFLRRGASLTAWPASPTVGSSLDHLIGTWSESEARELDEAIAVFECCDAVEGLAWRPMEWSARGCS